MSGKSSDTDVVLCCHGFGGDYYPKKSDLDSEFRYSWVYQWLLYDTVLSGPWDGRMERHDAIDFDYLSDWP